MSDLSSLPVFIPGRPYTMPQDRRRAEHLYGVAVFLWDNVHPSPAAGERCAALQLMADRLGVRR